MAEKKEKKGKNPKSKSKHKGIKIWKKYEGGKVKGRFCPRCGSGYLLGEHGNRVTCGKCHYSEIKLKK